MTMLHEVIDYPAIVTLRMDVSDLRTSVQYWSMRVMGLRSNMDIDNAEYFGALAMFQSEREQFLAAYKALKLAIDIFNEHDELGLTLYYDKDAECFECHYWSGANL